MPKGHRGPSRLSKWERAFIADLLEAAGGKEWRNGGGEIANHLIRCGPLERPMCPATAVIFHKTGRWCPPIDFFEMERALGLTEKQRRRVLSSADNDGGTQWFSRPLRNAMLEACGLPQEEAESEDVQ